MNEFRDLEALAQQDIDSMLLQELAAKKPQYQDAIPEEILDLLEEAAETYAIMAPALPPGLGNTAKKEIEFFISLYQDRIKDCVTIQNAQPPQKILRLLCQTA